MVAAGLLPGIIENPPFIPPSSSCLLSAKLIVEEVGVAEIGVEVEADCGEDCEEDCGED